MRGLFTASVLALSTLAPAALAQTETGSGAATQQAQVVPPAYYGGITLAKGQGKLIKLPRPVANLFVADDSIASVRPASPGSMFVFGKTAGETDVVATDAAGNRIAQYSVTVNQSGYAGQRIETQSQAVAPGSGVTAESEQGGMVVRGTVQSPEDADKVMSQAKLISPSGKVTNDLTVAQPIQVEPVSYTHLTLPTKRIV